MSDDRFKKARKSLIDRNKERRQEGEQQGAQQQSPGHNFGAEGLSEGEKTELLDVDQLKSGGQQGGDQDGGAQHAGGSQAHRGGYDSGEDEFSEAATQMVDPTNLAGAPDQPKPPGGPPSPPPQPGGNGGGGQQGGDNQGGGQQYFSTDDDGHEGKTDFINIDQFTRQQAEFAPESETAGYEGKTDFIHIDALAESSPQGTANPQTPSDRILDDQMLRQGYQFDAQSIQRGEVTLIFAQNPLGKQVVLRQVWEGDARQMPAQMRQRIAQLDALDHPRLVSLNGVVATQSGMWADLDRPEGYRLSAVLQQHGPQDNVHVIEWLNQIADVLEAVHAQALVYANLTPDAVWIQGDNSIVLEPFDLLSFEHRGALGPYGPPELRQPPEQQQLSPATDVYSMAAVGAASLTGLPFHPERLSNLEDEKLAEALQKGLTDNPAERFETPSELTDNLGGGFSLEALHPANLDIKVVGAAAAILLGIFVIYLASIDTEQSGTQQGQNQGQAAGQASEGGDDEGQKDDQGGSEKSAQSGEDKADDEDKPSIKPPGEVEEDGRLEVTTSYVDNPPREDELADMDKDEATKKATTLRQDVRDHLDEAEDLAKRDDRLDEYTEGLEKLTEAIRLNDNEPTDSDRELLEELRSKKLVESYESEVRNRVAEAIEAESMGEARFPYKRLRMIDYRADAASFFNRHSDPDVRVVHEPDKEDDEDDD